MRARLPAFRLLLLVGLCWVGGPDVLAAQLRGARVAAPGTVELRVGGEFSLYGARFGHPFQAGSSDRRPLTDEGLAGRISDLEFAPFTALRGQLNAFFDEFADDPFSVPESGLALTTARLEARADHRTVPFELEVGVLPRVSVGVRVPLVQHWVGVTGFEVGDGNVGWNPDTAQNRMRFAAVDSQFAALGASLFLPTHGSPAGIALRERVAAAAGGEEPLLPETPLGRVGVGGVEGVEQIVGARYNPALPGWELGDAEVRVGIQLLSPAADVAAAAPFSIRAAVELGARLPTGTAPDAGYPVFPKPDQGIGGFSAALRTDLRTPRLGLLAGLRWQQFGAVSLEQPLWLEPPEEGLIGEPTTLGVRWEPGRRLTADVAPYLRLVEELRLLGMYGLQHRSERFTVSGTEPDGTTVAEVLGDGGSSAHHWGLGIEYSTVERYRAGMASVPFEATVFVRNAFAGSGGMPADRTVVMQARLFLRLWGR